MASVKNIKRWSNTSGARQACRQTNRTFFKEIVMFVMLPDMAVETCSQKCSNMLHQGSDHVHPQSWQRRGQINAWSQDGQPDCTRLHQLAVSRRVWVQLRCACARSGRSKLSIPCLRRWSAHLRLGLWCRPKLRWHQLAPVSLWAPRCLFPWGLLGWTCQLGGKPWDQWGQCSGAH